MPKEGCRSVTVEKNKPDKAKTECCPPIEPLPCCVCVNKVKKPSAISTFYCEHADEIKYGFVGLAALGVLYIVRMVRAGQRFTHMQDIPGDYFLRGVMLNGRVHCVLPNGIMQVEHTPITRMPWAATPMENELLPIHLAAVDMNPDGQKWLEKRTLHRTIWFKLIHATPEYLACSVRVRKGLTKVHINEYLLKQGICRVDDVTEMPVIYPHLMVKLLRAENVADRKGRGMWSEETRKWWNPVTILKFIFLYPVRLFSRLVKYKKFCDKTSV